MKLKITFETEIPDSIEYSDAQLREWVNYSVKHSQTINSDNPILKEIGEAEAVRGAMYYVRTIKPFSAAQIILQSVSDATGVPVETLTSSKSRKREIVNARMVVRKLLYDNLGLTYKHIGSLTGKCDHTTVINSVKVVNNLIQTKDPAIMQSLD